MKRLQSPTKRLCWPLIMICSSIFGESTIDAQGPVVQSADEARVSADHVERSKEGLNIFKSHVRQILKDNCLDCHGGKSVKADFNLNSYANLMASGFVADTAEDSYLFELVTHESEPRMPLQAERLSNDQIHWIKKWIDLGSPYDQPLVEGVENHKQARKITEADREFWSFQPLREITPPVVQNRQWCRTPIDNFIQKKLEERGLSSNPVASIRTLVKRASLDAIGLPPELEAIEKLKQDFSEESWSTYVKGLLNSSHYGERWARHWMDIARFAESHGYEQDYNRDHAYHYRDFLIKAFNQDMPFDQFTQWQVAGDELGSGNPLAMMATGFLGAGVFPTQLTEAEFESARYDELDDMVATTGVTFLGLSVGCARCHDHKFDPITSADYYAFASNFTETIRSEIEMDLDQAGNATKRNHWKRQIEQAAAELRDFENQRLDNLYSTWLSTIELSGLDSKWQALEVKSVQSDGGSTFEKQDDQSWLAKGNAPNKEIITIEGYSDLNRVNLIRLEALSDPSLPKNGPGRAPNGNFALGDVQLFVQTGATGEEVRDSSFVRVGLAKAQATHQQDAGSLSVSASIDDDGVSGWAVDRGGIGNDQAAVFTLDSPLENHSASRWRIVLSFQHPNAQHLLGRFRLSFSAFSDASVIAGFNGIDSKVKKALHASKSIGKSDVKAWEKGRDWYKKSLTQWQRLSSTLESLRSAGPPVMLTKVMVSSEGLPHIKHHADGRGYPHFYPKTYVLERGDVEQKKEVASPGFLSVLTPKAMTLDAWGTADRDRSSSLSYRRSALARWMTDLDKGAGSILARVIVNRLWHYHFGQGLVSTPNDFGVAGSPPSHPELLDWLAVQLIAHDWQLKPIHQLIMTSSVYMQSAQQDQLKKQLDPSNRWLSRWQPRRAEAEVIRDSMLAVSGLLDRSMYGPGSLDENMKRRSIYFFIKRSKLIPSMMLFDWPEHLVSIGKRSQTTIAPQALSFLNSPRGREYAKGLAGRLNAKSSEEAVEAAFRYTLMRLPNANEKRLAIDFLTQQVNVYQDPSSNTAFDKACVDLCQMLLSTNEFIYIE